jgi:hypothetical protein
MIVHSRFLKFMGIKVTYVDGILRRGLVLFIAKEAMSWQW